MTEIEKVLTEDGSHTLFNSGVGEHYHSIHGAIQESMHVFIRAGFSLASERFDNLSVLEVGFGTGLNALLTLEASTQLKIRTLYTAYEPFPLSLDIASGLNYTETDLLIGHSSDFITMHKAADGELMKINPWFLFRKYLCKLQSGLSPESAFNLVYFDAFSPEVEPELWTPDIFQMIRESMTTGGVLVTYSARGEVRRILQSSGFRVERLPGPPGKREMLRATAI
ncbi:MAG: SAM-dependent methyltransferase [Bacteroidetes bacterium HGW-Bacteroidetes-11]|jgi:tRNA U34 5-methylaminomethyl-2-thiouridine-forming methyltransferase MnmC|nr:MAG: SAM-dependent methyltransferase [Bacteroidetes bacterium HGW-Bacteroidetes-11]